MFRIKTTFYRGEMTVATEDLPSLLKTAEILQVTGLSPSESTGNSNLSTTINQNLPDLSSSPISFSVDKTSPNAKPSDHSKENSTMEMNLQESENSRPQSSDGIVPADFMDIDLTCVKEVKNFKFLKLRPENIYKNVILIILKLI